MQDFRSDARSSFREPAGLPRLSDLARFRVRDILLVSSQYDSFILAEDSELQEVILKEFLDFNVRHTPAVTHVATAEEALALARERARYDLVIASAYVGDTSAMALARRLREAGIETPVVALAYDMREVAEIRAAGGPSPLDRVFLWQGDVRLLPAIVKSVEDCVNVVHDTGALGIQAILVIEDNVRYYSSFLPTIYAEMMHHAHSLVPEGVNLSHKLMRLQAQPKILLCTTYEEAWRYFLDYQENILGVISDIQFPKDGHVAADAGLEFARRVRERQPDVPVMLQSTRASNEALARSIGASFLQKGSATLLQQLRLFLIEHLGFGDFVFRTPDRREVGRARDLRELEEKLATVPAESLAYHAERNHFSRWFKARTEFALAHELRPRKVSDFESVEHLRREVLRAIRDYREQTRRGVVVDFDRSTFSPQTTFSRLGGGSLGGKARGLAFVDLLLAESRVAARFPGVRIGVPSAVVLGTDVFDEFLEQDGLRDFALNSPDEAEIGRRFVEAQLPPAVTRDLSALLDAVRYPLAVRSSSLLEDSLYQPFAGIYDTFMLGNDHESAEVRLRQLQTAIKRVYASTFKHSAKQYLSGGPYRLEEEKMAVVLQRIVGGARGRRFYPDLAGVARSYNYYPLLPMRSEDGIAAVALGLGEIVVSGQPCFRFCPRYPRNIVQFSSVKDTLINAQREFYALELGQDNPNGFALARFDLTAAEEDGTLARVGSTYSPENDVVSDGISRAGVRLVTFAPILKHGLFPLAEVLDALLSVAVGGTSVPVEIEFAVNFPPHSTPEFGVLQLRPLGRIREPAGQELGPVDRERVLCESSSVLGHGTIDGVCDVIVMDVKRFDRSRTREIARTVGELNARLQEKRRPYLLIGVGRWGSADPFLGIPVGWDQIAGARAIVEAGFADFKVTPSQGSHFFQNLAAGNIGYFTVNPDAGEGFVDWEWLRGEPAVSETQFVRHVSLASPVLIAINGRSHTGVILKPAEEK
ncbi:MAG TPA: PEP/pyruvate-binding domain-containing protein [Thermoanaerobaculia bacterium]|nr:PEP/pyruvate-binding domain-containing protein [Thermoanaerobaculia bacterium]